MTRIQKNRLTQMEELQHKAHELGCEMVQEWLDLQAELIRRSQEIVDIKGAPQFEGIREACRTFILELQPRYETQGQIGFKTLGVKAHPIKETLPIQGFTASKV